MKKLISFVLCFLIILNTFGFNLILINLIQESKTESLEIIDEHPESITSGRIVVFSLQKDQPEFINSREIRFEHEMYDIVYKKQTVDDTIIYCLPDKKETKIQTVFLSLNEINGNPVSIPDNLSISILKNLLKNYLGISDNSLKVNYTASQFGYINYLRIPEVIAKKISPPPQA